MVGTIVLSVLVVVLTRGSFERLSRIRLRALWLLLVALVAQIALEFVDIPEERLDDLGYALLLGTYVLILVFCLINRRLAGMAIVTLGIALNVLVIALNQGMPTKDDVVERNGREVRVPDRAHGEAPAGGARRPAPVPGRRPVGARDPEPAVLDR